MLVFITGTVGQSSSSPQLEILLQNNDSAEQQTKQQLLKILSTYDISEWLFTRKTIISSNRRTIPHSHPVLTIITRYLKDDELLMSTFIHEQFHWFIDGKLESAAADKEFRKMFPKVPVGFPEGANDEVSTYYHIQVCFLEYLAIERLFGELKARQIIEFWKNDHYTWIYKTILERRQDIFSVMRKHNLLPVKSKSI